MPGTRKIDQLSPNTRATLLAQQRFIFEHRHLVHKLNTRVQQATGVSQSLVSLTINGKAWNIPVIEEAHRLVSLAINNQDVETLKAVGAFQPNLRLKPEAEMFLIEFNTVREQAARIRALLHQYHELTTTIESMRSSYLSDLAALEAKLADDSLPLTDQLQTYIFGTLPTFPKNSDFPSQINPTNPSDLQPGETPEEYAIRLLKESGELTMDGLLPNYHEGTLDFEPGTHKDEESGQTYVVGRS